MPRVKKSDATRKRLLARALVLFQKKGVEQTTMRDIAKERPSNVIRMPAIAPTIVERDSRRAILIVMNTSRVPNTSGMKRQPNEFMPNSCSPRPISHLPTGGWTTNSALSLNTFTLPDVIESFAVLGQSFS